MPRKNIKDTDDMLSLQSCWCPPLDDEYKHWGKITLFCIALISIILILIVTSWDIYD